MAHRIAQRGADQLFDGVRCQRDRRGLGLEKFFVQAEVGHRFAHAVAPDAHGGAGRQGMHRAIEGVRVRHAAKQVIAGHPGQVFGGVNLPALEQGGDLRCKAQGAAVVCNIKRLDAERVAGQKQLLRALVPNAEGKHAAQGMHHGLAALGIEMEQYLSIGM